MALRIETALGLVLLLAGSAVAQSAGISYPVRHVHLRHGEGGTLNFTADGVSFQESGKHAETHSRSWKYEDIQRLELAPDRLTIVTYEDQKWQLGRDREYVFDHLPKDMASQLYPNLYARMDQRFVPRLADPYVEPLWKAPAKLLRRSGGKQGLLIIGPDRIVFDSPQPGDSRTWRYGDILNISSGGPFQLTLASIQGATQFQLKQILPEDRFNDLWRRINQANGLKTFNSQMETRQQ